MKTYKADLHIHTCLSPCAELEMSPRNIVREAKKSGLDVIGICDHNSCENVLYVEKSAEKHDLYVIGGIEITSQEEVHILAWFESNDALLAMQKIIYENLTGVNDARRYGDQVVVNEQDEIVQFNDKLLIGATNLSLDIIVNTIHELKGLAVASHIDRESFSILSQLGFIPPGMALDALEVSRKEKIDFYKELTWPLLTFSDAHNLADIGKRYTNFTMAEANLQEIKKSLQGKDGRKAFI
jgi:PHP family Zn ribbon phosphoesterase